MELPRVKLYGLFPVTRRRYLVQSVVEWLGVIALVAVWFWGWPALSRRLDVDKLPPVMASIRAVLANVPWIALGLAVFKIFEMFLVLRAFARRTPSPDGTKPDGQTTRTPIPGSGPGSKEADSRNDG